MSEVYREQAQKELNSLVYQNIIKTEHYPLPRVDDILVNSLYCCVFSLHVSGSGRNTKISALLDQSQFD